MNILIDQTERNVIQVVANSMSPEAVKNVACRRQNINKIGVKEVPMLPTGKATE